MDSRRFFSVFLMVLLFWPAFSARLASSQDETFGKADSSPHHPTWKCVGCTVLASVLKMAYFTSQSQDCLGAIVAKVCTVFRIENSHICDAISTQYRDEVLYVVGELLLNPRQFCGFILQNCSDAFNPLNNTWLVPLPEPGPTRIPNRPLAQGESNLRVLHLSDIHFDPAYAVGSEIDCPYPLCCRNREGENGPINRPAGKWGSAGRCDTPLPLLENLFQHLIDNESFDFMIWTGDIPPHDVWNQTRNDQLQIYQTVVTMLLKYFPNKMVFPAVGNHESAPADSFPPNSDNLPRKFSISWLYDALGEHWTKWIPSSTRPLIRNKASYMVKIFPGLRLVSINTNYCMATNFWLYLNDTDPDSDLTWLVGELYEAEKAGDKVHIIGHTPPGDPQCLPQWSLNYHRIINRFKATVAAQFFGHTHADQFSVFYENGDFKKQPINMYYVGPSVTTFDSYMPAYRIYTVDGNHSQSTWQVLDHETYFANVTEANLRDKVEWRMEYKAKEAYGLNDLSPASWNHLINRMLVNQTLADTFLRHFYRSNDTACDRNCQLDIFCQLRSARSHDSKLCSDFVPPFSKLKKAKQHLPFGWNFNHSSSIPFVPKECQPKWPWSKQMHLILNKTKFVSSPRANGNPNCDTIAAECHSDKCGQICEQFVASHIRFGQPSQLERCREAVCHVSTDCCCTHS